MFRILFVIVLSIFFVGCSSLEKFSDRNNISQDEFVQMVNNARSYAIAKEKRLNAKDIDIINSVDPIFSCYYLGPKNGQFGLTWKLTEGKWLLIDGIGDLTKKESLCRVSIKMIPGVSENKK